MFIHMISVVELLHTFRSYLIKRQFFVCYIHFPVQKSADAQTVNASFFFKYFNHLECISFYLFLNNID